MKEKLSVAALAAALALVHPGARAAGCDLGKLQPVELAGAYMGAAHELAALYGISRTATGDDVRYSLEAQGPLSSFSDATYLITDLLKLRALITNPDDRAAIDADIRGNLKLLGAAFYGAEDFLGHLAGSAQSPSLQSEINAARQHVADGIALYGDCLERPASAPLPPPAPPAAAH